MEYSPVSLVKAWVLKGFLGLIWRYFCVFVSEYKMKRSFFQAAVVWILLYGCTTWTLTKRLEKKLNGNYTRMLRVILNKSRRQHPTRHLPPITKTIQLRRTRYAGHCSKSRVELISDVLLWTPTYGRAKVGRPARTYIQLCEDMRCSPEDLWWTIGRSGKRGSGISVLAERRDDDADDILFRQIILTQLVFVICYSWITEMINLTVFVQYFFYCSFLFSQMSVTFKNMFTVMYLFNYLHSVAVCYMCSLLPTDLRDEPVTKPKIFLVPSRKWQTSSSLFFLVQQGNGVEGMS